MATPQEVEAWCAEHHVENHNNLKQAFSEVLLEFDVPALRRDPTPQNLRWLRRNIAIRNNGKQMLPWVLMAISILLDEEWE